VNHLICVKIIVAGRPTNFSYSRKSGHRLSVWACPLCARSRHAGLDWVSGVQGQERSLDAIVTLAGDDPLARVVCSARASC
jgi:hypothetical protein